MKYIFSLQMLILLLVSPQYSIAQTAEDYNITSVLWVQRSAEYRALCYQAYNLAELRVREYLANPDQTKPAAVIFDIDETLLDNSPSKARDIIEGQTYSADKWKAWTDLASAAVVPGSLEFCHFLAQHDIQLFYVTNRTGAESTATLLNMQKWDFPYSNRNHLFCKSQTSSKESRRNVVENQYNVILLVGDNLADFDELCEDRSVNFGFNAVDSLRKEFGKKFIVLPNPIYGDWTKPLTGDPKSWLKTEAGDKL
jgi:5'-nucleotidase (lipoprotein e(P4) family)